MSLPAFLRDMLTDHLKTLPGGIDPEALVFTNPAGGPIHQVAWLRTHFKPAAKLAVPERPGLRFHDLRHTAASLLIAHGAHPKAIQERLGHASITTTLDRYGHLMPGLDTALMAGLDAPHAAASAPPDSVVPLGAAEQETSA